MPNSRSITLRTWTRRDVLPCREPDVEVVDGKSTQFLVVLAQRQVEIAPIDRERRQGGLELDRRTQVATVGGP